MCIRSKQTTPYSSWKNAAEGAICKVKYGARRKLAETRLPPKLWNHCLELESMIRTNTSFDRYKLQGQLL